MVDREKLLSYISEGYTSREIALAEGTSQSTIRHWLKKHGLKTQHKQSPRSRPKHGCVRCGKEVERHANKYCEDCIADGKANSRSNVPLEMFKTDRPRKARLLQERGHQCERCGLTEWSGNLIVLEMHHVDGDADNNARENLQLLCPNCHALTSTYKAKNKGSSISRRKMYRKKYRYET